MPFKAHYTRDEVRMREDLIIKQIISLINDSQKMIGIVPYFLNYGIIDWAWPLRFVRGNEEYKGYKYYSKDAYNAVLNGQTKFTRDHIFPKKLLKEMLFGMPNPSPDKIRIVMETYGEICVITKQEDLRLRNAGLDGKMPDGWKLEYDVFARYQATGIQVRINSQQW